MLFIGKAKAELGMLQVPRKQQLNKTRNVQAVEINAKKPPPNEPDHQPRSKDAGEVFHPEGILVSSVPNSPVFSP